MNPYINPIMMSILINIISHARKSHFCMLVYSLLFLCDVYNELFEHIQ